MILFAAINLMTSLTGIAITSAGKPSFQDSRLFYETSHIHVQEYKNVFYMSSGMETEEEIKESGDNLNYLFQLGLLKADFSERNRLYIYHFLEQGDIFRTFYSKYKGIPDTRPIVERGTVILTEAGKTAVLVGRE